MFNHLLPDAIETGPLLVGFHGFLRHPQGFAIHCVLHVFTDLFRLFSHIPQLLKRSFSLVSRKATAIIRPNATLLETAGILSDQNHVRITGNDYLKSTDYHQKK